MGLLLSSNGALLKIRVRINIIKLSNTLVKKVLYFLLLFAYAGILWGNEPLVVLTVQERAWLKAHPNISLGYTDAFKVNVRVIAATNRNLEDEIEKSRFRQDLFYRLNVYALTIPPLRDRRDDIPLLVEAFIEEFNKKMGKQLAHISQKTMGSMIAYNWPGNIRELQNIIEKAVIVSQNHSLAVELPDIHKANN